MWELARLAEVNHNRPMFAEDLWVRSMENVLNENRGTYQVVRPLMNIDMCITSQQGIQKT